MMAMSVTSSSRLGFIPRLGSALSDLKQLLPPLPSPSSSITLRLPSLLQPLEPDSGIVLAVPKSKVSHRRKRNRQLAGNKQIKPLLNLNRCPSCGNYKRAHTLCMHCVAQIQRIWKQRDRDAANAAIKPGSVYVENLDAVDERILYPGKRMTEDEKKLKEKEYLYKRPTTLPVDQKKKK